MPHRATLERLARELDVEFEGVAYTPPEVDVPDKEIAASALHWAVEEWMRGQNAKILAGEEPSALNLGELGQRLSPENVQEWRSQHPERWPKPPYPAATVRVWRHRAAREGT